MVRALFANFAGQPVLVARDFPAPQPNQKWSSPLTLTPTLDQAWPIFPLAEGMNLCRAALPGSPGKPVSPKALGCCRHSDEAERESAEGPPARSPSACATPAL